MRFHEGEEKRALRAYDDDDDDEGHADNDEDVNSLMKIAPLLLYMHCETGRQLSLYLSQIECI